MSRQHACAALPVFRDCMYERYERLYAVCTCYILDGSALAYFQTCTEPLPTDFMIKFA